MTFNGFSKVCVLWIAGQARNDKSGSASQIPVNVTTPVSFTTCVSLTPPCHPGLDPGSMTFNGFGKVCVLWIADQARNNRRWVESLQNNGGCLLFTAHR